MIGELIVKCVMLIALIHGLRILARRIGPRVSGLILGLPSSTAVLLVLCGREKGSAEAIEMADASLLGLIAAVSLPLAYAHAVRRGWGLPAALAAAVAAYVVVAIGLGYLHPGESVARLGISCGSILVATFLVSRIGIPAESGPHVAPSRRRTALVRTIIPVTYVAIVGVVTSSAAPRWAGLVSTFPSMSTVVLAVTHLEEGAASASRIARALPPANLSTAAFLAAFRFGCPVLGLAWGTLLGYLCALINLAAVELVPRAHQLPYPLSLRRWRRQPFRHGARPHFGMAQRPRGRIRTPLRRHFAPYLEILPC